MKAYIDKDALAAEIESKKKRAQILGDNAINSSMQQFYDGMKQGCVDILSFLDNLEVKEEVLDRNDKTKLMQKCVKTAYKRGYDMGVLQTTNKINHNAKEVDLEKEFDNYAKDILACDVQFEPFTHLHNCAKHFFELGLKAKEG